MDFHLQPFQGKIAGRLVKGIFVCGKEHWKWQQELVLNEGMEAV
jgi:hypothetical protein